jgi:hypothetical protein
MGETYLIIYRSYFDWLRWGDDDDRVKTFVRCHSLFKPKCCKECCVEYTICKQLKQYLL